MTGVQTCALPIYKQNVVLATIAGLAGLVSPEDVAKKRGKSVDEIMA